MDALSNVTKLSLALKPAIISKRGVSAAFAHLIAEKDPSVVAWQAEIEAWMRRRKITTGAGDDDDDDDEMRVYRHDDFTAAVTLALAAVKTGCFGLTFNEVFLRCPGFGS